MRLLKLAVLTLACCAGLYYLTTLFNPSRISRANNIDFMQDFMLARAVAEGANPYLPLKEMGPRHGFPPNLLPVPSPHPPSLVVLILPLALLEYERAALVWLLIGLCCLFLSVKILFKPAAPAAVVCTLAFLAWPPVSSDLTIGQLMTPLLLLLALSLRSFRAGHDGAGGVLLGLAVSVKLIAWPLALLLLWHRKHRGFVAAALTVCLTHAAAVAAMGLRPVVYYYAHVGRQVAAAYNADPANISAWGVGRRFFTGTAALFGEPHGSAPLTYAPALAPWLSALCAAGVFALCVYLCRRAEFQIAFGAFVCLSVAVAPLAFWYYLPLLLIPLSLSRSGFAWGAVLASPVVAMLAARLLGPALSFWEGLLLLAPLLATIFLMVSLVTNHVSEVDECLPRGGHGAGSNYLAPNRR